MSDAVAKLLWDGITRIELMKADGVPAEGPFSDPGPPAPVAKQAPTAQELITAKVQQAAAALVAAGKAVDELAALSKIDPALADEYRRTNAAPTGVTILPQYQPAQTPGIKPTPQSESDRGLVGA